MNHTEPERYTVVLTPLHTGWRFPPEQRLRAALKVLLRAYGLRCIEYRPWAGQPDEPRNQKPR